MLIAIDAGHGGKDPGAVHGGVQEKDITLDFSVQLMELLAWEHKSIVMTRSTDIFVPLMHRVRTANEARADIFVSIHVNSCARENTAKGFEIWHHPVSTKAGELAADIEDAWTYGPIRGIKEATFTVLKHTKMPAVLIELGFINHDIERRLMLDKEWRWCRCDDIVYGINQYFERNKRGDFEV